MTLKRALEREHTEHDQEGYVYILRETGSGRPFVYKIGKSIDPYNRTRQWQVCGHTLQLVATFRVQWQGKAENVIHALFWRQRHVTLCKKTNTLHNEFFLFPNNDTSATSSRIKGTIKTTLRDGNLLLPDT